MDVPEAVVRERSAAVLTLQTGDDGSVPARRVTTLLAFTNESGTIDPRICKITQFRK